MRSALSLLSYPTMVTTTHTPLSTSDAGSTSDFASFPSTTPPGSREPTPTRAIDPHPEATDRITSDFVRAYITANPGTLDGLDDATAKIVLADWLEERAELMGFVRERFSLYVKKSKAAPAGHYVTMDAMPPGYGEEGPRVYHFKDGVLNSEGTTRYLIVRGVGHNRIVKTE